MSAESLFDIHMKHVEIVHDLTWYNPPCKKEIILQEIITMDKTILNKYIHFTKGN